MAKVNHFSRRQERVRFRIAKASRGRPRLSVFRSGRHMYAQVIDDQKHHTLIAVSTLEAEVSKNVKTTANREAASHIGKIIAEKAIKQGIKKVVFDRGGYIYHGRVKALADAAREAGLEF